MLEFILEHPVITIIIISVLYSFFFGKKKKAEGADASPGQEQQKSQLGKVQDALKRAMEEAEREMNRGERNKPLPPSVTLEQKPPVPVARIEPAQPDPFAFRSMSSRENAPSLELRSRNYDQTSQDYDIVSQDYDLTSKDYDIVSEDYDLTTKSYDTVAPGRRPGDPFAYHSAIEEPVERKFHLSGFQGFQSVHGLSANERKAIDADVRDEGSSFVLPTGPGDLRRAFIMREIFDRPRSMRSR